MRPQFSQCWHQTRRSVNITVIPSLSAARRRRPESGGDASSVFNPRNLNPPYSWFDNMRIGQFNSKIVCSDVFVFGDDDGGSISSWWSCICVDDLMVDCRRNLTIYFNQCSELGGFLAHLWMVSRRHLNNSWLLIVIFVLTKGMWNMYVQTNNDWPPVGNILGDTTCTRNMKSACSAVFYCTISRKLL